MDDIEINAKIKRLEQQIDYFEETDPGFISQDIRELRHRVFYVHFRLERTLEVIITRSIHGPGAGMSMTDELMKQMRTTWLMLEDLPFYKKLRIVKKIDGFKNKEIYALAERVNKIRNEFAHPEEFGLSKYSGALKLETLELLYKVMSDINKEFSEFFLHEE